MTESGIDFLIIFFIARFERNLILRVNVKKPEKRKSKKLLCVIFMNLEVLDQNGNVYFRLKNKSFFVYPKCLRFLNKSFQEKIKQIAPANYTAEVVCIDQILPKSS